MQTKRKPRTTPKHNVLQEKSITQKQISQNKIHTSIGNTNKQTYSKTSLRKQMLEQKMPHMPRHSNKTPIPRTTLGTTHTTKCNYLCRSNGIVYLVTCKRCLKHYLGQTSKINSTPATSETPTIPNVPNPSYR